MPDKSSAEVDIREDPFALAGILSERVSIESVILAESHAIRTPELEHLQDGLEFRSSIVSVGYTLLKDEKKIFVYTSLSVKSDEGDGGESGKNLAIGAMFVLAYSASSMEGIEDKHAEAFGSTNGIYNIWPYWREFVQNTSVRMGIKPIVVPVFRLG
jgi:hypothetical protein